ncbi:hypothetical protein [Streptomyces sp. NPDC018972]|uniref:hypothetical protein n=1 Tax=Streptomyces sp. NPDC018972 TaxID=3365060 RepID=UPI0037B64825
MLRVPYTDGVAPAFARVACSDARSRSRSASAPPGSAEQGTLPQLRAATDPGVRGGQFFGPSGFFETRGRVPEARLSREAADPAVGERLWAAAEELTGVSCL